MSLSDWWEFSKFVFGLLFVGAIIVALIIGCAYLFWISGFIPETPDPQDVYEDALNRCLSRETLSQSQCEDIALREAYPE